MYTRYWEGEGGNNETHNWPQDGGENTCPIAFPSKTQIFSGIHTPLFGLHEKKWVTFFRDSISFSNLSISLSNSSLLSCEYRERVVILGRGGFVVASFSLGSIGDGLEVVVFCWGLGR